MFGQTHKQFPKTNSNAALVAYSPQGCSGLDIVGTSQKGIDKVDTDSINKQAFTAEMVARGNMQQWS